jgi:hypothetical protein
LKLGLEKLVSVHEASFFTWKPVTGLSLILNLGGKQFVELFLVYVKVPWQSITHCAGYGIIKDVCFVCQQFLKINLDMA